MVARSPGRGVGPGVEVDRVVEHDEVRLADVERIVGRPEIVLVGLFGRVVVVGVFVVVVVARDVVDQGRDGRVLERVGVVAQVVLVRIPVEVEGHVADVHDVDLSRRSGDVVLHLGKHQLLVLGDVAQTVGQVDVGQHQQVEIILSRGLDQLEIDLFARLLAGGHRTPDQGHGVFRLGFVARRHAHEDVAVVFLRGEVVAARVVGRGDDLAVGDDHARDGQRAAEDHALDVHALLVGDFDVEAAAEFEDAQHLALPPAVHDEAVGARRDLLRHGEGDVGVVDRFERERNLRSRGNVGQRERIPFGEALALNGQLLGGRGVEGRSGDQQIGDEPVPLGGVLRRVVAASGRQERQHGEERCDPVSEFTVVHGSLRFFEVLISRRSARS